jgi:hypothetical protein
MERHAVLIFLLFFRSINNGSCGVFTPSSWPITVDVEVGGGGGSGGAGQSTSGLQGGLSSVTLITAGIPGASAFLQATGGGGGQQGNAGSVSGPDAGVGSAQSAVFLSDVLLRRGGGGTGGQPGTATSSHTHSYSSDYTGRAHTTGAASSSATGSPGAVGGFVSARVLLTSGQQLQACAGVGGAGASQTGEPGFVIIRGYF